ncbi:M16 family metallopeptidase [Siphonobacter sp. BAB-5385]|uniref:M16 family metallopeptidase n=1 Tax=Siphonobacter sp. BAB-5385 TaxID=1864822 RepID=UPI00268C5CF4
MKKILFFLLLALPGFSQNFKLPRYEKLVLPNGLTLMLMEQHEVPVLAVSVGLPAGAVYDGTQYGLANLTAESLKFGTKSFPKALLDEKLDFLGAQLSTYATLETATLTSSFAVKDQETVWPMIKEVLVNPAFDASEFEKRKSRLLVELKQAKQRPSAVLGEYFNHFYYGNQPYGSPADGTPESIGGITLDQVKNFYRTHYQPNGTVVSVVGDFNTAAMKAKLTTLFKDWKKGTAATQPPALKAVPNQSRVLLVNKENATETQIIIGQKGVPMNNPDYVGIEVVNTVLGARFTSWLVDELRVNHGYTYGVRSSSI